MSILDTIRGWKITPIRVLAVLVVIMAFASLYVTTSYNSQQKRYVQCGARAVMQTVDALRARDDAVIKFSESNKRVTLARYDVLLLLLHAANAPEITPEQALRTYETAVNDYTARLDGYLLAVHNAPLPDAACLDGGG
jgi:hypothetical protein